MKDEYWWEVEDYWEMMKPVELSGPNYSNMTQEELLIETVKKSVFDWIEKYHPRDENSNLRVDNPKDKEQLKRWWKWVIWRIEHQILWWDFWGLTDDDLKKIIAIALHEYFEDDSWYTSYLLEILPSKN